MKNQQTKRQIRNSVQEVPFWAIECFRKRKKKKFKCSEETIKEITQENFLEFKDSEFQILKTYWVSNTLNLKKTKNTYTDAFLKFQNIREKNNKDPQTLEPQKEKIKPYTKDWETEWHLTSQQQHRRQEQ